MPQYRRPICVVCVVWSTGFLTLWCYVMFWCCLPFGFLWHCDGVPSSSVCTVCVSCFIASAFAVVLLDIYLCVCVRGGARACGRVYACSLAYLACDMYAPYCDVICGPSGYHIFRHYLINGANFRNKLVNIKCVFWFALRLSKTFLILRRI
jgi:hypothetical protein